MDRRFASHGCCAVLATILSVAATAVGTPPAQPLVGSKKPPHIVLFIVDDLGWGDVNFHREEQTDEVQTPTMDRLVQEGIELNRQYLASACSPTRAAVITGRVPPHVNALLQEPWFSNPNDTMSGWQGIPRNMTGIGTLLQPTHATAMVGKWDAGMATPQHTPQGRGFDSSLCYFHHANDYFTREIGSCHVNSTTSSSSNSNASSNANSNSNNNSNSTSSAKKNYKMIDFWRDGGPAFASNATANVTYEDEIFLAEALRIINTLDLASPAAKPLFLYYAAHIAHEPYEITPEYEAKFEFINITTRRIYHAMVNYVDDVISKLVAKLKSRGMWDDTLFVLSTDNGGPIGKNAGANNYPLRGGKYSNWEGGVRGTAFVSGGLVPQQMRGTKLQDPIHIADWYATFAALAGVSDPHDAAAAKAGLPPVDSINLWPRLSGMTTVPPRVEIYGDGLYSSYGYLVNGSHKVILGDAIPFAVWTGATNPNATDNNPMQWNCSAPACTPPVVLGKVDCSLGCLYDVVADPQERTELSATQPDTKKALLARLLFLINTTAFAPNRGTMDPRACEVGVGKYGGVWGPFAFLDN